MTHAVPQAPGGEGTSLPVPCFIMLLSHHPPSAWKQGHRVGPRGSQKLLCVFYADFLKCYFLISLRLSFHNKAE